MKTLESEIFSAKIKHYVIFLFYSFICTILIEFLLGNNYGLSTFKSILLYVYCKEKPDQLY